ncbi:hypothetical protein QQM39_20745 [Streptomyces sp. DT2A-34]|uniref:hypothetical protein n=1 Tax=Streptomyces sp. DT2A-34 TaxID=3051182 RepID=UPI00265BAF50|nr:hypothetical protein [Streptomyces sp. DT2A-34]MDO0913192.1 hypothetical protein [Streptomyces sp. DT2A-34]
MKRLVTAGVWRRVVDAVVEDQGKRWAQTPTPSEGEGPTVAAVLGTLVPLLPKNLAVSNQGHDYPYVDVRDAKNDDVAQFDSTVRIDVQRDMSDAADELYGADAETLPDGTKVATRQEPDDKGVEGIRSTPALTIEQLREIALSPKWDQFR